MDCRETLATCPECRTSIVLEYVTLAPGARYNVDASCPHCLANIVVELPLPAIGYVARPVGTASVLKQIAGPASR